METEDAKGYLMALAAIFFWSFNIIIASYFATSLQPFEIAFGRWVVGAAILLAAAWKELRRQWPLLLKNWQLVLWLALTGIVFDNTLIYYAGRTASAVNMGLLDVTGPIFLVILARLFLHTPISGRQILGLAIAVLGVITVILRGDFTGLSKIRLADGDLIMLLNTFFFAVYSLLQARRPPQVSQTAMLAATAVTGVVIIVPFLFATSGFGGFFRLKAVDYGVFVYLGIFNSVLAYLAWNTALAKIGSVKTGIIYYLLPLFSGVEAYFLLHEKLYYSQLTGGILVIFGIALVSLKGKKAAAQRPVEPKPPLPRKPDSSKASAETSLKTAR